MDFYRVLLTTMILAFLLFFMGCAPKKKTIEVVKTEVSEEAGCSVTATEITSNSVVITGTAQFQAYQASSEGLVSTNVWPIRFAEVSLFDQAGKISQC